MKRRLSSVWWLALVLCAWLAPGGRLQAAEQAEKNAYSAACKSLEEHVWPRAESEFAQFLKKYPQSEFYAQAVLLEAQARFRLAGEKAMNQDRQWSYQDVISLLAEEQSRADGKVDEFAYWTAEAWYASSNFTAAARAYAGLAGQFTNSTRLTEALYREADALRQTGDATAVIDLLKDPAGAFQQAAKANPADQWVVSGLFLLVETALDKRDYAVASDAALEIPAQKPGSDIEWKRQYLLCRVKSEGREQEEALQLSTNLIAAADGDPVFRAESYRLLGDTYRRLERFPEAIAAYQTNLADNLPPEQQRQALLNIVELDLRLNQFDDAARRLQDFLARHAGDNGSDFNLLALGELQLREHFQMPNETNFLQQATTNFQRLIAENTNSGYLGNAYLGLGWCFWAQERIAESAAAFSDAVQLLPHDEDQAVALFKLGDALYRQTNYPGAISNYARVIDEFGGMPSVTNNLFEQALYQIVQAGTATNDFASASRALEKITRWFPEGLMEQNSTLLVGEAQNRAGKADDARKTFEGFITRWPDSTVRPEVELAIARTYERDEDWTNAINRLYAWVATYTNNAALPAAEFQLAWANYKAGNVTNAYSGFTNFVALYPSNSLSAEAQYWIGSYQFWRGEYVESDRRFHGVFGQNTLAPPDLQYQAQMMAGRAAFARQDFPPAIKYFEDLASDSNASSDLRLEAQYALADTLKSSASQTNLYPCQRAIGLLGDIATNHPGDPRAPLAWGAMGNCYLQLGGWGDTNQDSYQFAINCYSNAMTATNADLTTRSAAEYGIAQVLEKLAALNPPGSRGRVTNLWQAIDHYLNVVNGTNLRGGEKHRDLYWVEQAGLKAADIETVEFKDWDRVLNLYQTLQNDLPAMHDFFARQIEKTHKMASPLIPASGQDQ